MAILLCCCSLMNQLLFSLSSLFFSMTNVLAYTPKEGNISAILGPAVYRTEVSGSGLHDRMPFFGAASLLAIGDISDHGSLEVGMFHMNKQFVVSKDSKVFEERSQVMHITMGYRHWWAPSFSTSLSIYSSYPLGYPDVITNDFGTVKPTTSLDEKTTYGFDAAFQVELAEWDRYAIVTDLRYSRAFAPKDNEAADHAGILLGLRYFIQEKQVRTAPEDSK